MNRALKALGLLTSFLFLGSCTALFDINLYAGLEQVPEIKPSQVEDASLSELKDILASDLVLENMPEDTLAALNLNLLNQIGGTDLSQQEKLEAMEIVTSANLLSSGAIDFAEDIVPGFGSLLEDNPPEFNFTTDPQGAIGDIWTITNSVFGDDPGDIETELSAFVAIHQCLAAMDDSGDSVAGVNLDTVQVAIMGAMVNMLVDNITSTSQTSLEVVNAIVNSEDSTAAQTVVTGATVDPVSLTDDLGVLTDAASGTEITAVTPYDYLADIFESLSSLFGSQE